MATGISLTDEALAELLSGSRQKGVYDEALVEFVNSGEKGVQISLTEGQFSGKKSASVKTGFVSATKRDKAPEEAKQVAVIAKGDNIFLVRRDLVNAS